MAPFFHVINSMLKVSMIVMHSFTWMVTDDAKSLNTIHPSRHTQPPHHTPHPSRNAPNSHTPHPSRNIKPNSHTPTTNNGMIL